MAAFHDHTKRQAGIEAALTTAQDSGTSGDAERVAYGMAMGTAEAVAPSNFFHVDSTLFIIEKKLLKLWKKMRKGKVVTLKDYHGTTSIIHIKSIPSRCVHKVDRKGYLVAIFKLSSNLSRNAWVVIHGCSGPINNAKSLVMKPDSTVAMQTFSSAAAKRTTSRVSSKRPR